MTEAQPRHERTGHGLLRRLRDRAILLKRDVHALYFVARHPRTPWYARLLAGAVVAYALSPLDLIPDFIPVLGFLDDVIVVPLGIAGVLRLVPAEVLDECRKRSAGVHEATPISDGRRESECERLGKGEDDA